MSTFAIGEKDFLLNGKPFQILSGALHYYRVHPDSWQDRIRKAKLMGLNTIETYVAWNFHAPTEDQFHLSGDRDLGRFLDLVAAEGMYAIVRPGPYICAEWDNGGLPAWLTAKPNIAIRTNDPIYFDAVERYLKQLAPVLEPRQITNGGPIILFQVENEYGAYGTDKEYLAHLVQVYQDLGFVVPYTTVDQPQDDMLVNGSLPGLHKTGSFGSRAPERLATLRNHQKTGPLMCSEFWVGWFDTWGTHHHTTSAADAAQTLDDMLSVGASVNIYMFHGGTNFGFTSGANDKGIYEPDITSYDYDAPLAEDGTPNEKYWAFKEVIAKYAPVPKENPQERKLAPEFTSQLTGQAPWADLPSVSTRSERAIVGGPAATFEQLNHDCAFIVYEHHIADTGTGALVIDEVRDIAQVFFNGAQVGVAYRDHHDKFISLPAGASGTLTVLLEDQGRVNYGPLIGQSKGLGTVRLGTQVLTDWTSKPINLDERSSLDYQDTVAGAPIAGPVFLTGTLEIAEPENLFISVVPWGKGNVWVNGFNLGRYWARGPQFTLFVPQELLHAGKNLIEVFELHGVTAPTVTLVSGPDLGSPNF